MAVLTILIVLKSKEFVFNNKNNFKFLLWRLNHKWLVNIVFKVKTSSTI